ncbi:MAG: MarR family transcriptional regulator [Proteobacteria bacterium]|nr:MarR family transcriptional regulator [Pseudomonadota bacterium]MBU1738177.1 MarR family transcriptional regulator [Pseudomonadota bacterium]
MKYRGDQKERLALSTFVKLSRAGETISALVHGPLGAEKLTVSQFGVLEALYHLGPMCQKEIAAKILKSTANLTTVIDNLEKRELVLRTRNQDDRRYFTIALTGDGEELMKNIFPGHAKRIAGAMGNLTAEEQKQLGILCKKLAGKL